MIGVLILLPTWILAHFLIVGTIGNRIRKLSFLISAILLVCVYLVKPYTYDLPKYAVYFHTGYVHSLSGGYSWQSKGEDHQGVFLPGGGVILDPEETTGEPYSTFEPGFNVLIKSLRKIVPTGSLVNRFEPIKGENLAYADGMILFLMLLSLLVISFAAKNVLENSRGREGKCKYDAIVVFVAIVGSLFFFLGTQNNLRQFLGMTFLLLGYGAIYERKYVFFGICAAVAISMHRWLMFFAAIQICIHLFIKLFDTDKKWSKRAFGVEVSMFIVGLTLTSISWLLVASGVVFHIGDLIPILEDLKIYLVQMKTVGEAGRAGQVEKVILVLLIVVVSELVVGRSVGPTEGTLRRFRRATLCFIVPLALYAELFSRLLFCYFGLELLFVLWSVTHFRVKKRIGGVVVFLAYGVAPNAYNVLVGPGWSGAIDLNF